MSNLYFEQKSMDDVMNTLKELRDEIDKLKEDLTVLQRTLGRSAWDTNVKNFGFNKDI